MALSQELHTQCRATLLKCSEFDGDTSLRTVFATVELRPFRDRLLEANSRGGRVDVCLSLLSDQRLSDGRSALTVFIEQLRDRHNEGDALHDELGELHSRVSQELEETSRVTIPFVIAAMTAGEADALIEGTIFEAPTVAPVERARFREFGEALEEQGVEELQSHYGEHREDWQPYHCQQSAVRQIIHDTLNHFNHQRRAGASLVRTPPPYFSAEFFAEDEDTRIETWERLSRIGCIIIVDAISMFHPRLHQVVSDSEMGSNERVAILALSPVNSNVIPVNRLIEGHVRLQMKRAFVRFDKHLDKLCEFGLGDLRAVQRWLFAALPETVAILRNQRANPSNRRALRERMGTPRGMGDVIFGRRSRR